MLWDLWKRNSDTSSVQSAIEQIADRLDALTAPDRDLGSTSERVEELKLRVDSLELSYETLREECLRHLRRGSQRLKRAEEIAEDEQLEPQQENQMPIDLPYPEVAEADDFAWARQQIRSRGETPV